MITIVLSTLLGAATGVLLIPIYQLAFGAPGYVRLLWVFPIMVIFWGSLEICLWLRSGSAEPIGLIGVLSWIGAVILVAFIGWRRVRRVSR
jgi:hypothetical protein